VATKIRLMRLGKIRAPYYRIVVADSRTKRDGRVIETIGKYHPKEDPSFIEVNSERAQYWLGVGAQPTEPVAAILRVTGDWQLFKGEPAPAQGVKTAPPRPDRKAIFEAAAKESLADAEKPAKKTAAKKAAAAEPTPAAAPPADTAASPEAPDAKAAVTEAPATEAAATEAAVTEAAVAEAPAVETAAVEAPATEESAAQEPAAQEPAAQEPAAQEPAAETETTEG
jgi:small subunit ribosomal protein S16